MAPDKQGDNLEAKRKLAILLAHLGYAETTIAERLGVDLETVLRWLDRLR